MNTLFNCKDIGHLICAYTATPSKTCLISKKFDEITKESFQLIFASYQEHFLLKSYTDRAFILYPHSYKDCFLLRVQFVYRELIADTQNLPGGRLKVKETKNLCISLQRLTFLAEHTVPKISKDLNLFFKAIATPISNSLKQPVSCIIQPIILAADYDKEIHGQNFIEKADQIRKWMEEHQSLFSQVTGLSIGYEYLEKNHIQLGTDLTASGYGILDDFKMCSLPREIRYFNKLEALDVSGQGLETFPEEIGLLPLKYIDLSDCEHLKSFPAKVAKQKDWNEPVFQYQDSSHLESFLDSIKKAREEKTSYPILRIPQQVWNITKKIIHRSFSFANRKNTENEFQ